MTDAPPRTVPRAAYDAAVARLRAQYAAIPPGAPVRLAKRTSNLFRPRAATGVPGLDVSAFHGVLSVDTAARTADVLGMTTYEELVDATLPHGLIPKVVPQLRTITLGGAVTGLGIESTSFRNGLPHETVRELEVLTGDGRVVTATPTGEHRDLFHGFPNSYGTLGYALRLVIELEPVPSHVRLRHLPFRGPRALDELFAAMGAAVDAREVDGVRVDGLDATLFSPEEAYLTAATWEDGAPYASDYTGMDVYYRSIPARREDHLTVRDYLWRWDTDWFWCSKAFGAQDPRVRRLWPKAKLRSDTYWRLVALDERTGFSRRLDRVRGRPPREKVIQDVEIPLDRAAGFARWLDGEVGMRPVWACPLRQHDPTTTWDLYPFESSTTYVNFGFWGTVPLAPGEVDGHHDRRIEARVDALGGRKSLYSRAYYAPEDFWRLYGGAAYARLKDTYDADGRLLDLYAKCVGGR
ncbi:FAD-binding oxidoreductase [Vallicoccus soli]|uniref:FAD-binding oxidoreductase n=1 Tax=Vallicoccus soli TaxID=2339232 RepID=UPI001C49C44D|nr:FAD-binding oxidoreductase [Vallicoccus soli]